MPRTHSSFTSRLLLLLGLGLFTLFTLLPVGPATAAPSPESMELPEGGGVSGERPTTLPLRLDEPGPLAPGAIQYGADIALGGTREVTVVYDPNNPDNVAYADLFQLRVSTDGGVTWQGAVGAQVPGTHGLCGDPSITFDSQGRLFWTYLGCTSDAGGNTTGIDVFIAQCNPSTGAILPGYPVSITGSAGINLPAPGNFHDKQWIAADQNAGGPFQDRLYVTWLDLTAASRCVTTFSTDQGVTWSAPVQHSGGGEGFVWPCHNTVAPNGDVYVTYHSQPTFAGTGEPDGTSGQVYVLRSTDGGATFPQKSNAYDPGEADLTFNRQTQGGTIAGARFWTQGSVQPWILADPNTAGRLYVVANDDSDNAHGSGDDADVYIAISTDFGANWNAPTRIDNGPGTSFQVMPTAAIDPASGRIVVHYYDNRNGATNAAGRFLLDVYMTTSTDGGVTFGPDFQINDVAFDPDPGSGCRWDCATTPTTRIGEYNGVATTACYAFAVWCGNTFSGGGTPTGEQSIFDRISFDTQDPVVQCPADITVECTAHGGTPYDDPQLADFLFNDATATDNCDPDPQVVSDGPLFFPVGQSTAVTFTATDESGNEAECTAFVTVQDTTPPTVTCPVDITVECSSPGGTPVDDPQLAPFFAAASATDICDPNPALVDDAPALFPLGPTLVTFTATDAHGNVGSCSATVTVEDTTPPEITVELDRDTLWPPNHKLVTITAEVTVADICDPDPLWVLTSIESDEPENDIADGNTPFDIAGHDLGTPDLEFQLRSERQGAGDGRKYTVIYTATDMSGNSAADTVCVLVPHDKSGAAMAASGFTAQGNLESAARTVSLVVLSSPGLDATRLPAERAHLGNTRAVLAPVSWGYTDADGDRRADLVVSYDAEGVTQLRSQAGKKEPVGLRYAFDAGEGFVVSDIFALGDPIHLAEGQVISDDDRSPDRVTQEETPEATAETGGAESAAASEGSGRALLVEVFTVTGRLVRTLIEPPLDIETLTPRWDRRDDSGRPVSSGVYFYRIVSEERTFVKKVTLVR